MATAAVCRPPVTTLGAALVSYITVHQPIRELHLYRFTEKTSKFSTAHGAAPRALGYDTKLYAASRFYMREVVR